MADDRGAFVRVARLEKNSYSHVLGPRAAQAELAGEVAAQRSGDEQQSLAVFHRWLELAVGAGEEWWAPWHQLIGLVAAREQDRMASLAAELALQLPRSEGRHRSERAQPEQVEAFELFLVQRELVR